MSSVLRREDVAHVAKLARLTLSDAELDRFTEQLGQVLEHANDMSSLDLENVEATSHPFGLVNVVRDDVVRPSLDRDEVLAMAPTPRTDASRCRASWERRREDRRADRSRRAKRRHDGDRGTRDRARAIKAHNDELNVFSTSTRRAPDVRRKPWTTRSRAAKTRVHSRRADRAQGQPLHARYSYDVFVAHPRGLATALQRDRGRPSPRRGSGAGGKDQPRRVRHGIVDRELGLWTYA